MWFIIRYLVGSPRRVLRFGWQRKPEMSVGKVDADFVGCQRTRKSTSGGVLMYGSHYLKGWSRTLAVLALSTGESELMSITKGTTELLGMRSLARDMGEEAKLELASDATAAIGMFARLGVGKVRHLAVADLWVQQTARSRQAAYRKIDGHVNPGDMNTKPMDAQTMERHLAHIGYQVAAGRPQSTPAHGEATAPLATAAADGSDARAQCGHAAV